VKRTIRFVLFTGEEEGLFGSKAYVEAHQAELPKISVAIVHDTGTGKVTGMGVEGRDELKPLLGDLTGPLKDLGFTEGLSDGGVGPGTDHWSFHEKGVPGFAFEQNPAEYRLTHHSNSDTLDKAREPDLIEGAQIMSVLALRVADLPDLLPHGMPKPRTSRGPRTSATGTDEE
jgi:Zn-dependent M28 family amino/carboxypeptidase